MAKLLTFGDHMSQGPLAEVIDAVGICLAVGDEKFIHPKDHLTLQWKGFNLHSRGWVLKIATFEGSGSLGHRIQDW